MPLDGKNVTFLEEFEQNFDRPIESVRQDLRQFVEILTKWQKIQNLVSRETMGDLWTRHIIDSLQLLPLIRAECSIIVDLGSGGGFPAIPLAIALKKNKGNFHLIESNRRKASFLRAVSRELGLGVKVHAKRVEDVCLADIGNVDLITSRATTSLNGLLELSFPLWSMDTCALFHKGAEFGAELDECYARWRFDMLEIESRTSSSGVILKISKLIKN